MKIWATCAALLVAACDGVTTSDLTVLLDAEDSITEGLDPGTEPENVVDDWTVRFSKYVMSIGDLRFERTATSSALGSGEVTVVDLAALPASGVELTRFEMVSVGRWDVFEYAVVRPSDGARPHESVSGEDFEAMIENGWTHLIEGTLESPSGQSCPPDEACRPAPRLSFRFAASVETRFGPCQAEDGLAGVTITAGGGIASITIHGDHVFFDRFPSGAEVVRRRAQWLADADTDGDDAVTPEELMAIDAAALFPSATYDLAGAGIPIETAWDFVRAQLSTQGHFQGEGECPWTLLP